MQEVRRIESSRYNTQVNYDNDFHSKSREFGKDITNAFIGVRNSLEQNQLKNSQINTKQAKLGDFKNFLNEAKPQPNKKHPSQMLLTNHINPLSQSVNLNSTGNRFGLAPKQTQNAPNLKKNLKKQSLVSTNSNNGFSSNTDNLVDKSHMEIDCLQTEESEKTQLHTSRDNYAFVPDLNSNQEKFENSSLSLNHTKSFNSQFNNLILASNNNKKPFESENKAKYNIQEVPEYIHSIFLHIKESEKLNPHFYPMAGYMKRVQFDINEKMRAILLDWLVEVHLKFKLLPETFFLTINLIDRYLNKKAIHRTKLQLVGVTSMLIACKYEEIYAPEVKDFVFITDKAYTHKEVLDMELEILSTLQFDVTLPSPLRFLEMYHHFIQYDPLVYNFMLFLLDLSIVDYKMIRYKASLLAAAVAYVASKLLHKEKICYNESIDIDIEKLYELSGYSEEEIKECAKEVCLIYDYIDKSGLLAIKKKYSLSKYAEVSKIKFGKN